MINGWDVGPRAMTQVKFSVEPLLRKTSRGPSIEVIGAVEKELIGRSSEKDFFGDLTKNCQVDN